MACKCPKKNSRLAEQMGWCVNDGKGMRDEEKCWEAIGQLSCVLMGFQESWDFASSVAPCHIIIIQNQSRGRVLPYVTLRVELDSSTASSAWSLYS